MMYNRLVFIVVSMVGYSAAWELSLYENPECEGDTMMSFQGPDDICDPGRCAELTTCENGNCTPSGFHIGIEDGTVKFFQGPEDGEPHPGDGTLETCKTLATNGQTIDEWPHGLMDPNTEFTVKAIRGECAMKSWMEEDDGEEKEIIIYAKITEAPSSCMAHFGDSYPGGGGGGMKMSGDPMTEIDGKQTQFWLPKSVFVNLLQVGDLQLLGMGGDFHSGNKWQWITDFKVKQNGKEILHVTTKDPETLLSVKAQTTHSSNALTTLEVKSTCEGQTQEIKNFGTTNIGEIKVTIKKNKSPIGGGFKEAVTIVAADMTVTLFSSKANKFKPEEDKIRHMHMDMKVNKLVRTKATGVLPELWGLVPITPETKEMLHPPAKKHQEKPPKGLDFII